MAQLIVTVKKLNRRSSVPRNFTDQNIIGAVSKGFRFEGTEVPGTNASLGKWYEDGQGHYYWGGGLLVLDPPLGVITNIKGLPINLPMNYRTGIDISHHNNLPDWNAIKTAGISFCYIKLSEGVGTPDNKANLNAAAAKASGFKTGFYHFCRPDSRNGGTVINDAIAEAQYVLSRINTIETKASLPLVLDLEDQQNWDTPLNRADYLGWINTFIETIIHATSIPPIIYSRKEYLDRKLPPDHDLGNYKLWICRYGLKDCIKVLCPTGWKDWAMWQYTEDGTIGNNSKLDINILKDPTLF